jgi:hypothetical protein
MTRAALLGGLFIGVLSALPIINVANFCCCLWVLAGGALSVYVLQQLEPLAVTTGRAASVGVLAGVFSAFVWLGVSLVLDVILAPLQERMIGEMVRNATDMPPEVRTILDMIGDRSAGALRFALGFMFQLMAGVVFSTIGAIIGATFLRPSHDTLTPPRVPSQ